MIYPPSLNSAILFLAGAATTFSTAWFIIGATDSIDFMRIVGFRLFATAIKLLSFPLSICDSASGPSFILNFEWFFFTCKCWSILGRGFLAGFNCRSIWKMLSTDVDSPFGVAQFFVFDKMVPVSFLIAFRLLVQSKDRWFSVCNSFAAVHAKIKTSIQMKCIQNANGRT